MPEIIEVYAGFITCFVIGVKSKSVRPVASVTRRSATGSSGRVSVRSAGLPTMVPLRASVVYP